jgi:hypothetical protein
MTRTLQQITKDWEMRMGFTVRTLETVVRGKPVNRLSAYKIAKELGGCTDEEAKALADECAASLQEAKETA